jgi:hypothetical protein
LRIIGKVKICVPRCLQSSSVNPNRDMFLPSFHELQVFSPAPSSHKQYSFQIVVEVGPRNRDSSINTECRCRLSFSAAKDLRHHSCLLVLPGAKGDPSPGGIQKCKKNALRSILTHPKPKLLFTVPTPVLTPVLTPILIYNAVVRRPPHYPTAPAARPCPCGETKLLILPYRIRFGSGGWASGRSHAREVSSSSR